MARFVWKPSKENLSLGISVVSFLLSVLSLYVSALRITDDVRVVMSSELPIAEPDFKKKLFTVHPKEITATFFNAGTRGIIIWNTTLILSQPPKDGSFPEDGCDVHDRMFVGFDVKSFVVKPGEIISISAKPDKTDVQLPFSERNRGQKKVAFRFCFDVAYGTPSVEFNTRTVSEFEDELDESIMGYLFTEGKERQEHRPIQLVRRNRLLFFD